MKSPSILIPHWLTAALLLAACTTPSPGSQLSNDQTALVSGEAHDEAIPKAQPKTVQTYDAGMNSNLDVPPSDIPPSDIPPSDIPPSDIPPSDIPSSDIPSDGGVVVEPRPAHIPQSFRRFKKPKKISMLPPSQGKRSNSEHCTLVKGGGEYEGRRAIAALDTEMRRRGGLVLKTQHARLGLQSTKIGHEFRGPEGQRFMIVGLANGCSLAPTYVLTHKKEVFEAQILLNARKTRTIDTPCQVSCTGCGRQVRKSPIVAEVPQGSRIVGPRNVKVPISTAVVFSGPTCLPRP